MQKDSNSCFATTVQLLSLRGESSRLSLMFKIKISLCLYFVGYITVWLFIYFTCLFNLKIAVNDQSIYYRNDERDMECLIS